MRKYGCAIAMTCGMLATACAGAASHPAGWDAPGSTVAGAQQVTQPPATTPAARPAPTGFGPPVALVTAETENELLAVSLPAGRVIDRVHIAPGPQTLAAGSSGPVVVVSPASGTVTLVSRRSLRTVAVLRGFRSPQIATVAPHGRWALVSDAAAGSLSTIDLGSGRVVDRVYVGGGAHHMAISPDAGTVWVVLGETAKAIVIVNCRDPRHLRVERRLHPAVDAHDLAFGPGGATVWVSSAAARFVSVLSADSGRLIRKVAAGAPPQHIVFSPSPTPRAVITSGYGSTIETVDAATYLVLRTAATPYGSFNVAAGFNMIVTTSLLTGEVTEFDAASLGRRRTTTVAPAAREIALVVR